MYGRFKLIFVLPLLASIPQAFAGSPGAPAATSSDYTVEDIKVSPPKLEFQPGKLESATRKIEFGSAYVREGNGQDGTSVHLLLSKKYLVNGSVDEKGSSGALLLNPGLSVRIDRDRDHTRNADASVSAVGVGYFQGVGSHERPDAKATRQGYEDRYSELSDMKAEAQKRHSWLFSCKRDENSCQELLGESWSELDRKGAKMEAALAESAKRIEELASEMNTILVEVKKKGYVFKADDYCAYREGRNLLLCIEPKEFEVGGTADFTLASVGGVYRESQALGVRQYGAYTKFGETSVHGGFRVNGVNVDLCASIVPVAIIAGYTTGNRNRVEGVAKACAGVQLGQFARLGHEFTANTDFEGGWRTSNETSLKKIGGTPLSVSHTYEYETLNGGSTIQRNLFGAQVVF